MKIKIYMSNGKDYVVEHSGFSVEDYMVRFKNHMGIIVNSFVEIKDNVYINPSQISNLEVGNDDDWLV